jgi:hypothetical protein
VLRLKRVGIASIRLADLAPGEFRRLRAEELAALRQAARGEGRARRKPFAVGAAADAPRPRPARGSQRAASDAASRPHFARGTKRVRRKERRP